MFAIVLYFVEGSDPLGPRKAPEETSGWILDWTARSEASFPEALQRLALWESCSPRSFTPPPTPRRHRTWSPPMEGWLFLSLLFYHCKEKPYAVRRSQEETSAAASASCPHKSRRGAPAPVQVGAATGWGLE